MSRVRAFTVVALASIAIAGCSGAPTFKTTTVKDGVNGGTVQLNCVHADSGSSESLSCDFTPLHPQPTVTVTVTEAS